MEQSVALKAAISFDDGGRAHTPAMLPLPDHIRKLRRILRAVEADGWGLGAPNVGGVAASLAVAGSLYDIKADTAIDDTTLFMCGPAVDYANAESMVAARYLAGTIMFNFVWMALEEAIDVAAPPFKGSAGARGRNAFAHHVSQRLDVTSSLGNLLGCAQASGDMTADLEQLYGLTSAPRQEIAFELVRRIRNAFAHGDLKLPAPLDWGQKVSPPANPEVDRFFAATRLGLLLIALLLAEAMGDLLFDLAYEDQLYREGEDGEDENIHEAPAAWSLLTAHLLDPGLPPLL